MLEKKERKNSLVLSMVCVFLIITLMQIYNKNSKLEEKMHKIYSWRNKGEPENFMVEPSLELKKVVPSGQYSTQLLL